MAELITIQGKVSNAETKAPLERVKVVARQESTKIEQETDKGGIYSLHLAPGLWRIGAWAAGYKDPEAYLYNFTADTTGIDFHLEEGYSISGLVVTQEKGKPAPGVIVKAEAVIDKKTVFKQELTGASGKYRFSGLQAAQWQVQGQRGASQTGREVRTLGPDAYNANLTLGREMTGRDWSWGMGFFAALGVLLIVLVSIYLWAHSRFPPSPEPELSAITGHIEQAGQTASDVAAAGEGAEVSIETLLKTVAAIKENWEGISNDLLSITEGQNKQAALLLSRAETALEAKNAEDARLALETLKTLLGTQRTTYFWSEPPWNYLEVTFWSLAGILVSLLISSGYYLRRKRFYAEGIWMHVSHLLTVPLLALVVVFLISQVKLTVQIDDSDVALNINDPRLLAAISFIIAVRPWAMLEFVRETGGRFFSQIQSRFGGGGESQGEG